MRVSAPQCSFCLCRDPVHRVGSKCKALMTKDMNFELDAQTFSLISTLTLANNTNLIHLDYAPKPLFVHVQNKAASTDDSASPNDTVQSKVAYICTLYMHVAECLGTFIVPTTTIAEWTARSTCRVYISGTHIGQSSGLLSNDIVNNRKHEPSPLLITLSTILNHATISKSREVRKRKIVET
jgi:hypothetical protein